ncbi:MAG: NupC/NupG family nucleoside CNT transporter [Deltaproteobacteria bacterium]|nr:NupC/NupG family nucleoside CNT transporter [Deltaproteobacteria bacterium]
MFTFHQLVSLLGIPVLIFITWLFSNNKKAFPWRVVIWGTILQFAFALFVLKTSIGFEIFDYLARFVTATLDFTNRGADFVFGSLGDWAKGTGQLGFFAFRVLPTIIFISSLMSVLYYLNIMQHVVSGMAKFMKFFMGVSGAEALSCAANVFVGQTEAPLVIRPYISKMTMSELLVVMVGGMATVAGGVLAAYVGMGVDAKHLITASVLSAPAALVIAKIIFPEDGTPLTSGEVKVHVPVTDVNIIDAAANGAASGLKLALNVGAMLIAFIALIALVNAGLGFLGDILGINSLLTSLNVPEALLVPVQQGGQTVFEPQLTLELISGYLMAPFAWLMGTPWHDCVEVGALLGQKIITNEFIAYDQFVKMTKAGLLDARSQIIVTYALCGFANFSSIAIQIGGIGGIAPDRKHDLAKLGIKALIGGTLAAYMTANIAGILVA